MSTPQRATGKAAQKPIFQKPDDATDADAFKVEESPTTLDASDEVPEDDGQQTESGQEYGRRLETLELDHEDTGDRLTTLERIVAALCDSVYGKGVVPALPAPEEDVTR